MAGGRGLLDVFSGNVCSQYSTINNCSADCIYNKEAHWIHYPGYQPLGPAASLVLYMGK